MGHDNFHRVRLQQRVMWLVVVCAVAAVPAAVLRLTCAGAACPEPASAASAVPFCSLAGPIRALVSNGFREERSADVLAMAEEEIAGGSAFGPGLRPPWPRADRAPETRVPLFLWGQALTGEIPDGTTLDRVAPTIAAVAGIERAHPEVRSGTAIEGIDAAEPGLVVVIVLKGMGSDEVEASPAGRQLADLGASTFAARTGSVPVDPAAVLATIGTGGLPFQHGITGTLIRNDEGRLVEAWGRDAPVSVIATLGDDLDEITDQRALIGLVATDRSDRGIVGGDWYVDVDRDDVSIAPRDPLAEATRLLDGGYGDDDVPDLLAYVGGAAALGEVPGLVRAAEGAADRPVLFVLTATGSAAAGEGAVRAGAVAAHVERSIGADVVEATTPGGLFLDQAAVAEEKITEDKVLEAMDAAPHPDGGRLFADAFSAISVTFSRYC